METNPSAAFTPIPEGVIPGKATPMSVADCMATYLSNCETELIRLDGFLYVSEKDNGEALRCVADIFAERVSRKATIRAVVFLAIIDPSLTALVFYNPA